MLLQEIQDQEALDDSEPDDERWSDCQWERLETKQHWNWAKNKRKWRGQEEDKRKRKWTQTKQVKLSFAEFSILLKALLNVLFSKDWDSEEDKTGWIGQKKSRREEETGEGAEGHSAWSSQS